MSPALADIDLERAIPSGEDELWYTRCPVPTSFEIALNNGLFDEEFGGTGLDWLALAESTDPAVHHSHFTHRKANSFRHGGNIPAIFAQSHGADTRVIGVSWPKTHYPVMALPESGIRTAADLKGKRLLVPVRRDVEIDFWRASTIGVYEKALASAGLTFDDVELVEIENPPHRMPGAGEADDRARQRWSLNSGYTFRRAVLVPLVSGQVDAVTSQASMVLELAGMTGAEVVFEQADQPDLLARVNNGAPDTLTVSGELAERHPERVARVIVRMIQASRWAKEHHTETIDLFAQRLQIPAVLLEATYGDEISGHLDLSLPPETAAVLESEQDVLYRHGFIPEKFDVEAWIDPRPLELAQELLAQG